jgi:hypothetical protein
VGLVSSTDEDEPPAGISNPTVDRWPTFTLDHAIEEGSGGRQCTIYPTNVAEERRLTSWITASEDSYIGIDEIQ